MATVFVSPRQPTVETPPLVLPLATGDRLTRDEFERRYAATPGVKKAELVEGVVYVPSPVRFAEHAAPQLDLLTWLGVYRSATPGVEGGDNSTVRLDNDNEPQPDGLLRIDATLGGQSRVDEQGYVAGPPELIAEVSASSASYDLHDKFHAFRRAGVCEYIVWRVLERAVDWFVLRNGKYERLPSDDRGVLRSGTLPGLWLDAPALVRRDLAGVLKCLQEGLATSEHAEFVARLREASSSTP